MKNINTTFKHVFIVLAILISLAFIFYAFVSADQLKVHFIDVGQADSIFIELPNEEVMLIDAGNNADGDFVVNYIQQNGVDAVDYLVGTHPHADHIGGLDDVIKSLNIGTIYMPGVTHTTKTFEDVLLAIKDKGKKIKTAKAGTDIINIDNLKATILSPISDDYEELNNWSVVIRLAYNETSFLFMGDAEKKIEGQLLAQSSNILKNINVLKVSHHGSNSSTEKLFLDATSPKYAVICVGEGNRYGHPSSEVINRLKELNVELYRTDHHGTIISVSDGENISFNKSPLAFEDEDTEESDKSDEAGKTDQDIIIESVDLEKEIVIIKNTSDNSVDISGWRLLSVKGGQEFYFPEGTVLASGDIIKVVSGRNAEEGPDILKWTGAYIWNNEGDPAELYDGNGKLISTYKN